MRRAWVAASPSPCASSQSAKLLSGEMSGVTRVALTGGVVL